MAHYLTQESALRVNGLCAEVYGDLVLRADDHIFTQGGEEYINCGGVVFDDPGAHAAEVLFGILPGWPMVRGSCAHVAARPFLEDFPYG